MADAGGQDARPLGTAGRLPHTACRHRDLEKCRGLPEARGSLAAHLLGLVVPRLSIVCAWSRSRGSRAAPTPLSTQSCWSRRCFSTFMMMLSGTAEKGTQLVTLRTQQEGEGAFEVLCPPAS